VTAPAEHIAPAEWPVAILAGGVGTRLRPLTEKIPKALVPVAGEPFLAHQLRLLRRQGFRKVVLCVGYLGEMIEAEFGGGERFDLRIEYSFDGPRLLLTGGSLKRALPQLGDKFLVLYGDSYLPIDYMGPLGAFLASGKPALMTVYKNEGKWDSSNVRFEGGEIRAYDKTKRTPEMQHIDYGLGVLRSTVFASWPEGEPFELEKVYQRLVTEKQLAGHEVKQRFYEIGSPQGLSELDSVLRRDDISIPR